MFCFQTDFILFRVKIRCYNAAPGNPDLTFCCIQKLLYSISFIPWQRRAAIEWWIVANIDSCLYQKTALIKKVLSLCMVCTCVCVCAQQTFPAPPSSAIWVCASCFRPAGVQTWATSWANPCRGRRDARTAGNCLAAGRPCRRSWGRTPWRCQSSRWSAERFWTRSSICGANSNKLNQNSRPVKDQCSYLHFLFGKQLTRCP